MICTHGRARMHTHTLASFFWCCRLLLGLGFGLALI
jgi:hypothetical protein